MKKYTICIEETISQEFEVEAESDEDAMATAEEKYWKGEFVVDNNNVTCRQMAVTKPDSEASYFTEF